MPDILKNAMSEACLHVQANPIIRNRPNDAGNDMEDPAIEIKTFNKKNRNAAQRALYLSPPPSPAKAGINRNAHHLLERVKKSRDATTLRHSRESGNPEAAVRYTGPFLLRKRRNGFPLSRE